VRHGLLQQHGDAALQEVEGDRDVLVVRRADVHDVRPELLDQLPVVGEPQHSVALLGVGQAGGIGVAHGHQLDVRQRRDRREVHDGDVPAPDHGRSRHEAALTLLPHAVDPRSDDR
jgi:hypothetical protein